MRYRVEVVRTALVTIQLDVEADSPEDAAARATQGGLVDNGAYFDVDILTDLDAVSVWDWYNDENGPLLHEEAGE